MKKITMVWCFFLTAKNSSTVDLRKPNPLGIVILRLVGTSVHVPPRCAGRGTRLRDAGVRYLAEIPQKPMDYHGLPRVHGIVDVFLIDFDILTWDFHGKLQSGGIITMAMQHPLFLGLGKSLHQMGGLSSSSRLITADSHHSYHHFNDHMIRFWKS